jgi:hypothetical protein
LEQKKYAEAEVFARECLAIRSTNGPDRWTTFLTQTLVGAALAGQGKFADSEPFLVQGCEGLKQREAKIPQGSKKDVVQARVRLVQLYDSWGKPAEADKWRMQLQPGKP